MMKVNALVDLFFTDRSWEERVKAIAETGCRYIETWQGEDAEALKRLAHAGGERGVSLMSIVMNGPPDNTVAPVSPENHERFLDQIDQYADNALAAGCNQGIVTTGPYVKELSEREQNRALIAALRKAGERVADRGFRLNLEPLNTIVDHPGYFLENPEECLKIVKEVDMPNVRMLYDIYHMTIVRGNQTVFIENNIEWIGHFHAAGVPGRHEPFLGESNYPFLLHRIERAGYEGYMGLEYHPSLPFSESLSMSLNYMAPRASSV